jgi:hypothetical protein
MLNVIGAQLRYWWTGGRRRLVYMRVTADIDLADIFTVIGAKCNPGALQKDQAFTA